MGLGGGLLNIIWIIIAIIIIIVLLRFLLHVLFILPITTTGAEQELIIYTKAFF